MRSLSLAQTKHILYLLDSGQSAHQISSSTGIHTSTISRLHSKHCSSLQKSLGGCPSKLTPANTRHAIHLITSRKAENAVQITRMLKDIINTITARTSPQVPITQSITDRSPCTPHTPRHSAGIPLLHL